MKKHTLTTLIALAFILMAPGALAQSCYLQEDGTVQVEDLSIDNQKKLWNSCIDRKLAKLDPRHPHFFEMGQEIGDRCTSSQIICE